MKYILSEEEFKNMVPIEKHQDLHFMSSESTGRYPTSDDTAEIRKDRR